jgi:hypothetical protein
MTTGMDGFHVAGARMREPGCSSADRRRPKPTPEAIRGSDRQ